MTVLLPGDAITVNEPITSLRVGPGVREVSTKLHAVRSGVLGHVHKKAKHDESVWVEGTSKRVRLDSVLRSVAELRKSMCRPWASP
jgi:hypothetical protein